MAGNSAPLQLFGDFGFVGGEDTAPNPLQDNQTCINWYAEVDKQNAKEVVGLNGCPGLVELVAPLGGGVAVAQGLPLPPVSTLALLHLDGTNGSTTFTDVFGNTWTASNGATLSTAQAKFGPSSLTCNTNKSINTPDNAQWHFAGDFTLEFFFYVVAFGNTFSAIVSKHATGSFWILVQFNASNLLQVECSVSGGTYGYNVTSGTVATGQWNHFAVVRQGGTINSYLNGTSFGSGALSGTISSDATALSIGGDAAGVGQSFNGFIDEIRISNSARYTGNFTPPSAAFTDVPVFHRVWENDSTGFPLYNGSTGAYVGIPSGLGTTQIRVYDRGGLTTAGTIGGDGNTYLLATSNGAVLPNTTPNAFESPIQTNDVFSGGAGKFTDTAGTYAGLVMPHIAGTFGVYATGLGAASTGILQNPTRSGSSGFPAIWTEDYATGTRHTDVIASLSTPPGITGTWKTVGAFPCADFRHFCILTSDNGTGNAWVHLMLIAGNFVVSEIARYQFSTINSFSPFDAIHGFFNKNGLTSLANWNVAMMESNLTNIWLGGSSSANTISVYSISAGQLQIPAKSITAFASSPGNITGIFADAGSALYTDFTRYAYFTNNAPTTVSTGWPIASTIANLPVRGMWELPTNNTALVVIGNICYLVTLATQATPTAFATLQLTNVGTLQTNIGPVHIRDNDVGGYAVIVDGPYGYLYNISTQTFTQITDPAFLGADTVAFIDGWWIFNQPGTQVFYTNGTQYGIGFNASFFALKDGAADNLKAVFENKEQLWLLGDKTTEVWYDAGGQYFAFQRLVGTLMQFGCKAPHSVARFSTEGQDGVILFGRSERGENTIIKTRGFSFDVVSTPAFSTEVAQYPITSDAIGYTYQEDTHEFYVLIFPTADTTWCYDAQSGLLHKRLSYDPYLQKFHRHRSNCFMNFQGMRIVGDYQCGSLYQLTRNVQTDAGWPMLARRRSPHIWDKSQRGRTFMASLQADFRVGLAPASGLGSNPQAKLRISRDGGITFGQQWPSPMGQIGQYKTRTMWRKLGFGRDNVVELEVIDPVPRDIIGVTLRAFSA